MQYYVSATFLILAICVSQLVSCRKVPEAYSLSERHEKWMVRHGKVYKDAAEKERRFNIFRENVEFIESFNADPNRSYKLSTNEFVDQTNEEFKASLNGYKRRSGRRSAKEELPFKYVNVGEVPASLDWRKKGAVTAIKDQLQCGKNC